MRSFISTFCIFTFVPLLLASGVAGRPIRIRDITQTMASDARATTTKAEPTYPLIFTHKVDFTGPGADSISVTLPPGVIESTSNTIASASVIIDTSSYVEATASPSEAKQTSTSASTSPTAVALPETYNPQVAPSIITSMEKEKQTINSSFEHGDLAGQTINGFRLYLPLTPSPLRHGFVPL
ncbi:hypothetical protein CPB86DRAFT_828117 [Serendipita vermifera]|nr:hypothetical protein CPB86DRAFT_828117 [Serendipita vermifera]